MMNYSLTRYPIVALPMNQVSDLNLAIATRRAGALPSMTIFNYILGTSADGTITLALDRFENDLVSYRSTFGDLNLMLSASSELVERADVLDILVRQAPTIVEVIVEGEINGVDQLALQQNIIDPLHAAGCRVFKKSLGMSDIMDQFDGLVIKSRDGAGAISQHADVTLERFFSLVKAQYPDIDVIVSGGICTPEQVKYYIDHGAYAVGVGTLFAATTESCISAEAKQRIIEASDADIKKLRNRGNVQNALIFSSVPEASANNNNTRGLMAGIRSGTSGHIFLGTGAGTISSIDPVDAVVQRLVASLDN